MYQNYLAVTLHNIIPTHANAPLSFLTLQYGFTKVRRGADTDMYTHPYFKKDDPEGLLQLRKIAPPVRRRLVSDAGSAAAARSVSPATTGETISPPSSPPRASNASSKIVVHGFHPVWNNTPMDPAQISPGSRQGNAFVFAAKSDYDVSSTGSNDRGKLDLLAFALEQEFAKRL
jgi:hypothetical protein